jgi:hypothetical protein
MRKPGETRYCKLSASLPSTSKLKMAETIEQVFQTDFLFASVASRPLMKSFQVRTDWNDATGGNNSFEIHRFFWGGRVG